MNTYTIKKVSEPIAWSTIPALTLENRYHDTPASASVTAKIAYTDDAIAVYLNAYEPNIRAEEEGTLGSPCHDSCLEFFFSPVEGDNRYFNIEFNSKKCMFLGFGSGITDLVRLVPDPDELLSPVIRFTEDGWEITYKIPYSFIRLFFPSFEAKAGKTIRANCYKCADMMEPAHFLSWNLVTVLPVSFHRPCDFGLMTFGE